VRLALGAEPGQVMVMVVRQAVAIATLGAAIGVVAAVLSTRALQGFLFGVRPIDAPTLAASAAALIAAAVLASAIPARRATRVSPTVALRTE
jgi:ABC-type antimicrobial peptide transport system permease subunit